MSPVEVAQETPSTSAPPAMTATICMATWLSGWQSGDMVIFFLISRQHEPHSKQDRDRSDARAQQAGRTKHASAGLQDETVRPDRDPDSLV